MDNKYDSRFRILPNICKSFFKISLSSLPYPVERHQTAFQGGFPLQRIAGCMHFPESSPESLWAKDGTRSRASHSNLSEGGAREFIT